MDIELLEKGIKYAKKRRWVFLFGFTCYGAYRIYNSPSIIKKRQRFSKFLGALVSLSEMLADSSDAIGILSKDLKHFLRSDSDQIPQSFKQFSKLTTSHEFSNTLSTITRASAVGILNAQSDSDSDSVGFSDKVMNKIFSDSGAGFASAVVGSFARNTVTAVFSEWQRSNSDDSAAKWIEVVCDDKCRKLVGDFIQVFVTTAVTVYLDKTMNVNAYNDFFVGLTNPKHESKVKHMLASICNGAVETALQTYFTTASSPKSKSFYFEDGFSGGEKGSMRRKLIPMKRVNQESGWMKTVRSTLTVPGNREFVLDMTGVVTFETVRSFMEFLLEKVLEGMKTSVDVVQQEVVDKGVEAIRYASGRSSALTAVCLTLCLNIVNSPWILVPN